MSKMVIAGGDPDGLGEALKRHDATVSYAEDTADRSALISAGILDTDVLAVTDVGLATSASVALECNPDLRVVFYTRDSVPEFIRGQASHIVDPALLDADTVAEELLR